MNHYLEYIDEIHSEKKKNIQDQHPDWKFDKRFSVCNKIIPIAEGVNFQATLQLRKRKRTSVIFEHEYSGRKVIHYFSEYEIIRSLIYIYDNFEKEGNDICSGLNELMKDAGQDVMFDINNKRFTFRGIKYLHNNISFLTLTDYQITLNDFICLLNLVIEKDRYSKESKEGKTTILKYLLFLYLISNRTSEKLKAEVEKILKSKDIYKTRELNDYKEVINRNNREKIYFDIGLYNNILCYNNNEES
jgi:hypothetical protein